jgi:ubiquinone/menaquinone biosynthesis C-methylase UbiE
MLTLMKKRSWEVYGTEWTQESAQNAREVIGSNVMVGELFNLKLPDRHFDGITLWHVFEHTFHPRKILAEIARILKPEGLLIIALHNFDSRMARLGGRNWFNFDAPRHLMHFTPPQLQKFLAEYGFRTVDTSHLSWEFDPYCWLQTLYNKLGFEHNLFYTMIRRRDWWQKFTPKKLFFAGGILLFLFPLGLIAVLMAITDGLGKQNGTFINYAVKVDKAGQAG